MIVITGATGTVGRETVRLLLDAGHDPIAISRNPERAGLPAGARVVRGDPSAPASLTRALEGADAMLISPRAAGRAIRELLGMAARAGVHRVVVISSTTVQYPAGEPRFAEGFRAVERAAQTSGLASTALRCADFDANTLAWSPQIRASGTVRGAYPEAATSPVHHRDIAAVAVRTLIESGHAGRSYVLTGPQSLTQLDKTRILGDCLGTGVSFLDTPPEQVRAAMRAQGLPEEIPARLLGSLADYARTPGPTTHTIEQLLGRPALSFAQWAGENIAAFRN